MRALISQVEKDFITLLFNEYGIHVTKIDEDANNLMFCELSDTATDSIRILLSRVGYSVEIFPSENSGEQIQVYTFADLHHAVNMFQALLFYRKYAVKPFISYLESMI